MTTAAVQIVSPESLSAQVEKSEIVAIARTMLITLPAHVESATATIRQIKERKAKIDATFDSHIKAAHAAHKALVATKKGFTDELDEAERIIKGKIGTFELEQRKAREEAERKAREEAEAEQQKILAAAQAKITKAMTASGKIEEQIAHLDLIVNAEDSTENEKEMARRQIEVLQLKLEGQQERAELAQKQAEIAAESITAPVNVSASYERTKGVKAVLIPEVTDKMKLIQEVAAGRAPESILDVNMGTLKKLVNMGVRVNAGVVLREDTVVTVR